MHPTEKRIEFSKGTNDVLDKGRVVGLLIGPESPRGLLVRLADIQRAHEPVPCERIRGSLEAIGRRVEAARRALQEAGLSDAEIKRVVDPRESFQKKRLKPTSTSKRFRGNVFTRTLEI